MTLSGLRILVIMSVAILGLISAACTTSNTNPSPRANDPGSGKSIAPNGPSPTPVRAELKSLVKAKPVEPSPSGPRVQAKIEAADYGEVGYGDIVDQTFDLTNVGSAPLVVKKVAVNTLEGC